MTTLTMPQTTERMRGPRPATEKQIAFLTDLLARIEVMIPQYRTTRLADGVPLLARELVRDFWLAVALPADLTDTEASILIDNWKWLAGVVERGGDYVDNLGDDVKAIAAMLHDRQRTGKVPPTPRMPQGRWLNDSRAAWLACEAACALLVEYLEAHNGDGDAL